MAYNRSKEAYDRHRQETAKARKEASEEARDIGDIPPVENPERRAEAERALEFFLRTYFPSTFNLAWSEDHRRILDRAETAAGEGGLFAFAMPRGSGKTTIAELAALWAIITGRREFVLFIGSDEASSLQSLENLKVELETNELLLADFPETVYPIVKLEGIPHRCNGQTYRGERTYIGWTAKELVLPTIPGSKASGGVIKATGLTGRIRGMSYKRADGKKVRPSLAILDDPQTDDSAKSPSQVDQRERIVNGAVLGLAGPGRKIAAFMPCTVIAPDDLADRFLNRQRHPAWQGERTKLVYQFPTNEKLWDQYRQIREESLRAGNGITQATEFYVANREAMDAGSKVAWPARFNPDEVSALQNAMNLRFNNEAAFFAEYQNEPQLDAIEADLLPAVEIAQKLNGASRGVVPIGYNHLTAFCDVQGKLLYWMVCAWGDGMGGAIVDYGTFPDQKRQYFTLADAKRTLAREFPTAAMDGQIYQGLGRVCEHLLEREWQRADGAALRITRMMIDANWGESTDTVYAFCRATKHAAIVMPSHGKYVGASTTPFDQYRKGPGEVLGHHWMIPAVKARRAVRHVLIDTNYWKTFVHQRLKLVVGDKLALSLFGRDPNAHQMISEQLASEYRVRTTGRGRTVDEWKQKPGRPDNHGLDCLVGCAAGASMLGIAPEHQRIEAKPKTIKRNKVKYL